MSAIVIDPFLTPPMVGWKLTEIVQLAETGSDEPHVFVSAKSPDATMLPIVRGADPVLESVIVCNRKIAPAPWFEKLSEETERATWLVPAPLPLRAMR